MPDVQSQDRITCEATLIKNVCLLTTTTGVLEDPKAEYLPPMCSFCIHMSNQL